MGAAAIPLAIAGLGAGASYYNTQQTARRQDRELARQIQVQGERQRSADALVQEALLEQQNSTPELERQSSMRTYLDQLTRTQGQATAGLGQAGAVSSRYSDDAEAAAGDIAATGQQTADIMSRIDAPLRQRQNEGINFGRLGSDIARIGALSDSDRFIGDIRMRGIRRNPWLDAAAGAAQGYAMGSAAGGFGAGAAASGGENVMSTFRGLGSLGY